MNSRSFGNIAMPSADNAMRKIALVVASLDRGDAERLLRQFSAADARRIRAQWDELQAIDPVEQEAAITECLALIARLPRPATPSPGAPEAGHPAPFHRKAFRQGASSSNLLGRTVSRDLDKVQNAASGDSGDDSRDPGSGDTSDDANDDTSAVELDDSLARKFADRQRNAQVRDEDRDIWERLADIAGTQLGPCLHDESPTAIAIVLARLPAERAAETLHNLPSSVQIAVVQRMADAKAPTAEWVEEIGQAVWERVRKTTSAGVVAAASPQKLAAILAAAEPQDRARWASVGRQDRPSSALAASPSSDRHSFGAMAIASTSAATDAFAPTSLSPTVSSPTASSRAVHPNADRGAEPSFRNKQPHVAHATPVHPAAPKPAAPKPAAAHSVATHPVSAFSLAERTAAGIDSLADLARLDESTLAALVNEVDPWLFALALAGAAPAVARRWMERLGPDAARDVQRQLTLLGPWRLSDAIEAERRLVRVARELVRDPSRSLRGES